MDFFKEEKTPDLISQLASAENAKKGQKKEEEEEEEEEEVLDPLGIIRVEDDLEKLLKVTSKPKPKVPSKPPLPQKPVVAPRNNTNSSQLAKPKEDKIQTMNEVDILQYIQENESIDNEDTSLF